MAKTIPPAPKRRYRDTTDSGEDEDEEEEGVDDDGDEEDEPEIVIMDLKKQSRLWHDEYYRRGFQGTTEGWYCTLCEAADKTLFTAKDKSSSTGNRIRHLNTQHQLIDPAKKVTAIPGMLLEYPQFYLRCSSSPHASNSTTQ
jgi:hypothetical protein